MMTTLRHFNRFLFTSLVMGLLCSCSVFTPNPGENEADTLIQKKQYDKANAIIEPLANQGIPWARLRLGIAYEYGQGKPQDAAEAITLYHAVALQMQESAWADGLQILSAGDKGYFNQNSDARVAQYLMARLYFHGGRGLTRDIAAAWHWATYVQSTSGGKDVLFCCENSKLKTQYITQERISSLLSEIEKSLPADELNKLRESQKNWAPE